MGEIRTGGEGRPTNIVYRCPEMRSVAVLLATFAFAACATVPSGIFSWVDVGCGKQALIFSNPEQIDERVVVKATDNCEGNNSEIRLMDAEGKVLQRFAVRDGVTETIQVTVRGGQWLNFACEGKGGRCSFSVTGD